MHRATKISPAAASRGIGISAASSFFPKKRLEAGLKRFAKWGYPVFVDERVYARKRNLAGDDQSRAGVLMDLLENPAVGTIWCARGGYGATRLLGMLDQAGAPKLLKNDPKLLLGYSDVTALHLYFYQRAGIPSFHAPMPAGLAWQKLPAKTEKLLRQALRGELPVGKNSYTLDWNTKAYRSGGAVEGEIIGGNLTLLMNMIGTPWMPDLRGKILFLEDIAEAPYRVDRMLCHLENSGALRGVAAVLLGDFETDVVYDEPKERHYWKEIFLERFPKIPLIANLPVGHGKRNEPLPLGVRISLSAKGRITILEQPVQR